MDLAVPAFHPSSERLAAYASGWAPWSVDLCVRSHLETCVQCQAQVAELEVTEAAVVDTLPEAPVSPALLDFVAQLEVTPVLPPQARALGDVLLPQALADANIAPRRWISPGFWVAPLPDGRKEGWRTYILRAPAGQRLPSHGHAGAELVCVLSGAFEDGARYEAGDFVEASSVACHDPVVTPDGPCACLIATEGPLITRGLNRLVAAALSI